MKRLIAGVMFAFFLFALMPAYADAVKQSKCPVLGNPISKTTFTDYKGKRIYFCCPPCIKDFKKDPEKYMKKLKEEGVVLEEAPKTK